MKCQKSKIFEHVRKKPSFFQTKAQGLPISTIVIAALAILVLVILFFIVTGRMGIFAGAASECPGLCISAKAEAKIKTDYGLDLAATAMPTVLLGSDSKVAGKAKTACDPQFEQLLRGRYIASVRGPAPKDDPITCRICCVTATQ